MKTKRSLTLHGHRTSVALEPIFWTVLDKVAQTQSRSFASLIQQIDDERTAGDIDSGLASHLRVWCMEEVLRGRADPDTRK